MARITRISYRTNAEVRPYVHEHCEVTVDVNAGEDPAAAFELAKAEARRHLGIDVTEAEVEAAKLVLAKAARLAPKAR